MAEFMIKKPNLKRFCKLIATDEMQLHAVYQAQYLFRKSEAERKKKA